MRVALFPVAALALAMASAPARAQLIRYECRTVPVTATSQVERSQRAARNGAESAWVASARSQHRFAYRWALAQEVDVTRVDSRGSGWVGTASAYPCRVYSPGGELTVSTNERERVCNGRPSLNDALRHRCDFFYPLRR